MAPFPHFYFPSFCFFVLIGGDFLSQKLVYFVFYGSVIQLPLFLCRQLAEERIGNVRTVRAFGKEMHEMKKYDSKVDYVLDLAYKEAMARAGFFGLVSGIFPSTSHQRSIS